MIKKRGDKFVVTNKSGTKILGTHPSKEKAAKQLAAIEISKAKHMHEDTKRFKDFRSTLNESEYSEVLTGYGYRSAHSDGHGIHHLNSAGALAGINAMLATISRGTYLNPNEAFMKMRVRLNVAQLDFDWKPGSWDGGVGSYDIPVRQFGRVDGYDALTGQIRFDGKANPTGGYTELNLHVDVELNPESLYVVSAKLTPKIEIMPEGVEHDGEELDEMAQTAAREAEMKRKQQKHSDIAQRAYQTRMTKTGKQAKRAGKIEDRQDRKIASLIKRDWKEQDSPRTYGRGGKLVKRGSRAEVKEEIEAIEEMHKVGDTVKVPHKGKMVKGKIVRHDSGGSSKAAQHGGGYVVDVGEYGSITVPHHKIVKEGVEAIEEMAQTRERQRETIGKIDSTFRKLEKARKEHEKALATDKKEYYSKKLYGKGGKVVREEAEQIDEAGAAKAARLAKAKERAGREGDVERFERASAVQKRIAARLHKKKGRVGAVSEELIGGQKKLDVNKNKKLDAQDFALLRAKKKPVAEAKKFKSWTPRLDKLMQNRDAVRVRTSKKKA